MARNMKDSGIEWIGEIPEGWTKNKVIRLFDTIGSGTTPKNITSDFPVVNWIQFGDITGSFMPTCKNVISANLLSQYSALKVYPAPFIIIAMYGASVGNASISLIDGCVNQACCVLFSPSCNLHYAFYVIKSAQSYLIRKAVGGGQPNISQETIKQLWLPLPPLSTQDIIVRNLDATCSKIDDLLISVRSSIEEYKKLKQAVITQAVTKTIYDDFGNPSKFRKLRSLCDVLSKGTTPKDIETQNDEFYCIRYLKSENIVSNQLNLNPTFFITAETNNSLERSKLNSGDILFVIAGASIGKVAITTADFLPANTNQAVAFIRLSSSYQYATKYIWYFLQSDVVKQLIALSSVQSAQPNLSLEDLGAMRLPLPDQMGCLKITDYLDAKCAEIDKLIAKKEQLVKELESYKKSLIYEVVTGKREV